MGIAAASCGNINKIIFIFTGLNQMSFPGNEKCRYKWRIEYLEERMCYVQMPSDCSDLRNSTAYPGLQLSEEACGGKIHFG